jgi:hypothetical protein
LKKLNEEGRGADEEKIQLATAKVPRIAGALFPLARHLRAYCGENENQNKENSGWSGVTDPGGGPCSNYQWVCGRRTLFIPGEELSLRNLMRSFLSWIVKGKLILQTPREHTDRQS